MDLKWILLVAFVLALMVEHQVKAEYRVLPHTPEELELLGLVCAPGRTIIKLIEREVTPKILDSGEEEEEFNTYNNRRTHMNTKIHEEYCKVCVCSVEGKDEYCSGRPAMNVNECIRMSKIMEDFNRNEPFEHTRDLSQRIRRDYIWHNDEIPYESKAKCRRGHSYYSNSLTANDTDIDVASDVESLLDYSNKEICFYCVCSPDGRGVGCISRKAWYCEYYRKLRDEDHPRDMYRNLFQQDRPSYFRQLSWRLRRTMDNGLYDFATAVGGDDDARESCVPFVSEYTNCNAENQCSGCMKCMCILGGRWSCETVRKCREEDADDMNYNAINTAMNEIQDNIYNYNRNEAATSKTPYVPQPSRPDEDLLLDNYGKDLDLDMHIASLLRNKRSTGKANSTGGVKFYHTVDEINEDTLKVGNKSGTLQAHKIGVVKTPKISRRTGALSNNSNPLHIAHNEQKPYDPHIADNTIDTAHKDDKYDALTRDRINAVVGNRTQKQKDKELSKLVVNELKPGEEIIGDKNSKVVSNITFTPENDTLTAMAFIAGNLLNKLWNMEKDSGEDSIETEVMKHEKIADLIELFKDPLNLRQESFLKNALEQLSGAIDKNKNLKNVSLCDKIEEAKSLLREANRSSEESTTEKDFHKKLDKVENTDRNQEKNLKIASEAIDKINNVLSLINKFQKVHKNLNDLKKKTAEGAENLKRKSYAEGELLDKTYLSQDESSSLNVFGKVLEKFTKLLLPPKAGKKITKNIKKLNVLRNPKDVTKKIKDLYNIDIDSSDLTPKDKIVFDYLSTIKRNPKCILDQLKDSDPRSITKIEGDILLNLSEFFKVKSFVDLMKMVEPETKIKLRTKDDTTSEVPKITTISSTTTKHATTEVSNRLQETKEKLKSHLKTIIDDLIELQNAKGHPTNNISIVDALPCIYNILNADNGSSDRFMNIKATTVSPISKVVEIFNSLKQELISMPARRSSVPHVKRPRSAAVWERIFKNYDNLSKLGQTRRNFGVKQPKTFEDLKKLMDDSEIGSKTYKNQALLNGVPPSERLVLLKTLSEEVKQYMNVLEEIDNSMPNFSSWSADQKTDVRDFIDNAATNINLDENIARNINKLKVKNDNLLENKDKVTKKSKDNYVQIQSMKRLDINPSHERKNSKLTRDAIINQLIKNRMELYIKLKESEDIDLESDINYSIAKKVLTYLEIGNYTLARELYKIIVAQKQKMNDSNNQRPVKSPATKEPLFGKVPVVQFEEPRGQGMQWLNQDIWLKQLANLRNMKA